MTLTLNTSNPNPTVQWFTDSPTKVQIVPNGTSGATLKALGHSSPGPTFDIKVWVTVDGVSSAQFPVYINTPWVQSHTGPSPTETCISVFGFGLPFGWIGQVTNTVKDLVGNTLIPIDARETFENETTLFAGQNWGIPEEASWPVPFWEGNTFIDTYGLCWVGFPSPIPPSVSWGMVGGLAIFSATQKYWIGSTARFQGACSQRHAVIFFTNHVSLHGITTPIANPDLCAQGQFVN